MGIQYHHAFRAVEPGLAIPTSGRGVLDGIRGEGSAVLDPMEIDMTDKHVAEQADHSNMEKDPDTWVTGEEPMTGAQKSYLKTLSEEARVPFDEQLTKAEASKRIDELQEKTGRGQGDGGGRPSNHKG
jgi:hypothetical protein